MTTIRYPYRCAIIGLGRIASQYEEDDRRKGIVSHAGAYNNSAKCKLVAGCDPDQQQRLRFVKQWPEANVYDNVSELLQKEAPQIVSICAPTDFHVELIHEVEQYNPLGIFCEKPLASNLETALSLKKSRLNNRPPLLVNFSRRWDKVMQKFCSDIAEHRWGKLLHIDSYYTGTLNNVGSHMIDCLNMLVGPISWIQSITGTNQATMGFVNGATGAMHQLTGADYLFFDMDFYFSHGRVRISNSGFNNEAWEVIPSDKFSGFMELQSIGSPYGDGYLEVMTNALNNLISHIEHRVPLRCGLKEGLFELAVEFALHKSIVNNGSRIDIGHQLDQVKNDG